jgi:hypothetical protein
MPDLDLTADRRRLGVIDQRADDVQRGAVTRSARLVTLDQLTKQSLRVLDPGTDEVHVPRAERERLRRVLDHALVTDLRSDSIRAETILNNHRAKIIGAGISCPTTLQHVTRILGDQEIRHTSTSTSSGEHGRHGTTESSTWRALAPANVLREAQPGTAVLIYDNLPPATLRLRPWYADRRLKQLATPAP